MKKCIRCREKEVKSPDHDLCYECFQEQEEDDDDCAVEDHFEDNLETLRIHTTYIMFYGNNNKIGYTNDLNSRIVEIKRDYSSNKLVYFREFTTETEARRFEAWLKKLSDRELNKFVASFQDKIRKIEPVF